MEAAGQIARTNEVLFASVTRDELEIIGLFDHAAFEHEDDGTMTPERVRLWQAYQAREATDALPGQLMAAAMPILASRCRASRWRSSARRSVTSK